MAIISYKNYPTAFRYISFFMKSYLSALQIKRFLFLCALLTACTDERVPMDAWESQVAKSLKADYVEFFHQSTSSSTDGVPDVSESFIELDIYNSGAINDISFNDRLFSAKRDEIKEMMLNVPTLKDYPGFREVKIKFIDIRSAWIFESQKVNFFTYSLNTD